MNLDQMIDGNLAALADEMRRRDSEDEREAALEFYAEEIAEAISECRPISVKSGYHYYKLTYTDFSQWCGENGRRDENALMDFAWQYAEARYDYMRDE